MEDFPQELYEYCLFTCDFGEPRNSNYVRVKSFDDHECALKYASEVLGLKPAHELYEFEIVKQPNKVKIKELLDLKNQYVQLQDEKIELINNIRLASQCPPDLESKSISELMRIYYATINDQCPQCGGNITKLPFTSIYPSSKS